MIEVQGKEWAGRVKTDLYEPIKSDPRWLAFLERNNAMDEDLSHVEFNPQLPEIGWTPSVIRPAANR